MNSTTLLRLSPRLIGGVGVIVLVCLLGAALFNGRSGPRPLQPIRPTPTLDLTPISQQPLLISFGELNNNPQAFQNRFIQATGVYTPQTVTRCEPRSGPVVAWALVSEQLQMDALGFEQVVRLVPPGTLMTVQGVWRLYDGPFGCGKEPPAKQAWYLQVTQIVQPNPLLNSEGTPIYSAPPSIPPIGTPDLGGLGTPPIAPANSTPTASATATIVFGETVTPAPTVFGGTSIVVTLAPPLPGGTATVGSSFPTRTPNGTSLPGTATGTPTSTSGTPTTATPTASATGVLITATATQPGSPPPTNTPPVGGYPVLPTSTATPTAYP